MVTPQRRENSPICNLNCFINALFSKTVQKYCFLVRCARFPKGRVSIFFWKNCTKLHTPWRVIPNRSLDLSKKVLFIKIAFSFPSLIPTLIPPREHRETTERRAKRYRALATKNSALFLRLSPKKVDLILEKVVSSPKTVDSFPEKVDIAHQPLKKMHFFAFFLRYWQVLAVWYSNFAAEFEETHVKL